jgi:hypothetical protein
MKQKTSLSTVIKSVKDFVVRYRQPILFALLGIVAGVLSSVLNHQGEFWKWGLLAKTASQYGFWIIFVTLIIIKSKKRKLAVLNVCLFCFLMCIAYGIIETLYKIPEFSAGNLYPSGRFGNGLIGLFLDYEISQVLWFIVIGLLVPISMLIFNYIHGKCKLFGKIVANAFVIAPLLLSTIMILTRIANPVVVCADISNGWTADICTFQSPDFWIILNLSIEAVLYVAFIIFWIVYSRKRLTLSAKDRQLKQ